MSEFGLPFWAPFWGTFLAHFGSHFGVHFGALEIQLDAFGIPGGHHFGVKWWIHQKTVPGPPFRQKNLNLYGEKLKSKSHASKTGDRE